MPNEPQPAQPEAFAREPIPAEVREQALRTLDLEQVRAGIKEIRETGGVSFDEFIDEFERKVLGQG